MALLRPPGQDENSELIKLIQKAHSEWESAENRFNQFTNSDLIDCSIYEMLAARSKYQYLLQCAKEKGLCV